MDRGPRHDRADLDEIIADTLRVRPPAPTERTVIGPHDDPSRSLDGSPVRHDDLS
jgi:hypothetical protein